MAQNKFLKVLESLDQGSMKLLVQCMDTDLISLDPKVKKYISFCIKNQSANPNANEKKNVIQIFELSENAYNNYLRKANNYLKAFLPLLNQTKLNSRDLELLDFYDLKNLKGHFEAHYKSYVKRATNFGFQERIEMYQIEKYAVQFDIKHKPKSKTLSYQRSIDLLDITYWTERLYLECAQVNRRLVLNIPFTPSPFLSIPILSELENIARKSPLLKFYLRQYHCLTQNTGFEKVKRAFLSLDRTSIGPAQFLICLQYVLNYCVMNQNVDEFLEVVDSQIKSNGLLDYRDEILPSLYKNIIVGGLAASRIKWTEQFVEHFKEKLPADERNLQYELGRASVDLHKQETKKILDIVIRKHRDYKSNDPYEKLLLHKLLVQAYLLEEDYVTVIEEATLFLRRINRSKLPQKALLPLSLFLKYSIKVAKQLNSHNSVEVDQQLLKEIRNSTEPILSRDWLAELLVKSFNL